MPLLRRPLTDTVVRPVRSAVVWGTLVGAIGLAVAVAVGGVGYGVTWIASLLGDAKPGWPGDVVVGVAVVAGFASLAASARAAAFASTERPAARTVLASLAGAAAFAVGVAAGTPVSVAMGAIAAWPVAIPFERWTRLASRVGPAAVAVVIVAFLTRRPSVPTVAVVLALTYPSMGALVAAGDRGWRILAWRRIQTR